MSRLKVALHEQPILPKPSRPPRRDGGPFLPDQGLADLDLDFDPRISLLRTPSPRHFRSPSPRLARLASPHPFRAPSPHPVVLEEHKPRTPRYPEQVKTPRQVQHPAQVDAIEPTSIGSAEGALSPTIVLASSSGLDAVFSTMKDLPQLQKQLLDRAARGLAAGEDPEPIDDGEGATYMLRDEQGTAV